MTYKSPYLNGTKTVEKQVNTKRILTLIDLPALASITEHIEKSTEQQFRLKGLLLKMSAFILKPMNCEADYYKCIAFGRSDYQEREDTKYAAHLVEEYGGELRTYVPKVNNRERLVDQSLIAEMWREEDNYDIIYLIALDSDYTTAAIVAKEKHKTIVYTEMVAHKKESASGLKKVANAFSIERFIEIVNRPANGHPYRKL